MKYQVNYEQFCSFVRYEELQSADEDDIDKFYYEWERNSKSKDFLLINAETRRWTAASNDHDVKDWFDYMCVMSIIFVAKISSRNYLNDE